MLEGVHQGAQPIPCISDQLHVCWRELFVSVILTKKENKLLMHMSTIFLSFFLSPQLFHGIDIQAQDNDGFTAFHLAAREGNTKVLQTLLDTGIIRSIF